MIAELTDAGTVATIEAALSRHLHRRWRVESVTDLAERSSHPAVVFAGPTLSVFAKLAHSSEQLADELAGLELLATAAGVRVPAPIGPGWLELPGGAAVLLAEALPERAPVQRCRADWESIGRTLARIHLVGADHFGLDRDGWFGPLRQDNRCVRSNTWADFYAERRLVPWLATATAAGNLPADILPRLQLLIERLPDLIGPEPTPCLLHGDAQHHNFVSTPSGAVVIDPSPYFGHPELDLALLDYFVPVPPETFAAYTEIRPIPDGFTERIELWRVFAYLAILTADGASSWGRSFIDRLSGALARYT